MSATVTVLKLPSPGIETLTWYNMLPVLPKSEIDLQSGNHCSLSYTHTKRSDI